MRGREGQLIGHIFAGCLDVGPVVVIAAWLLAISLVHHVNDPQSKPKCYGCLTPQPQTEPQSLSRHCPWFWDYL